MSITKEQVQAQLKTLVMEFTKYDDEKEQYVVNVMQDQEKVKLDQAFKQVINQLLLTDGVGDKEIKAIYLKVLCMHFHNDRRPNWLPEVVWLDKQLSINSDDALCFKTVDACYFNLTQPQPYKNNAFNDYTHTETNFSSKANKPVTPKELKQMLEECKKNAKSYTSRYLFHSLLKLMNAHEGYVDDLGKLNSKGLQEFLQIVPYTLGALGAGVLLPELLVIYAASISGVVGGNELGKQNSDELKLLGETIQELGMVTAAVTSTLLVRTIELAVRASKKSVKVSSHVGLKYVLPFLGYPVKKESRHSGYTRPSDVNNNNNNVPDTVVPEKNDEELTISQQIILASKSKDAGIKFINPQLKAVAAPIELYVQLTKAQPMSGMRLGLVKCKALEEFLLKLQNMDKVPQSISETLIETNQALFILKQDKNLQAGKCGIALTSAQGVIALLNNESDKDNNETLALAQLQ